MIIQTSGNSKGPAGILCGREAWGVGRGAWGVRRKRLPGLLHKGTVVGPFRLPGYETREAESKKRPGSEDTAVRNAGLPLLTQREAIRFKASFSQVLNGRLVEISRGFSNSQLGSTVGKALQSPLPPPGIWVRFPSRILLVLS